MTITAAPQRGLKLDWPAVTGAVNYRIDRDVDATDGVDNFGVTAAAAAAAPTQSYTFTNLRLVEAMNHRYRIRAFSATNATLATAFATVSGDLAASIDSLSNPVDDSSGNRARVMATALREPDNTPARHVLAVGLPGANQGMGLVKIYERVPLGGAWTEVQTLSLPQAALGDFFGASVALSPNALWLAVGAPGDDHATAGTGVNPQPSALARDVQDSGAVQVYRYVEGQGWTAYARFKALNAGAGDAFGTAVAISNDGHLLVGAPNEDSVAQGVLQPAAGAPELGDGSSNVQDRGAVYAYVNTAQGYAFDAYVKPGVADDSQSSMYFGAALAMDALGQWVAVGAPRASFDGAFAGGVVFYKVSWAQQGDPAYMRWSHYQAVGPGGDRNSVAGTNPSPASPAYRGLGGALSMSADGKWLAAGYAEKGGLVPQTGQTLPSNAGQAVVYRLVNQGSGDFWAWHSSPVAPAPRANDRFGTSLALVNDSNGLKLLVGTPEDGAPHKGVMRAADIAPVSLPSPSEAGAGYYFIGNASDPSQPLTLKARLKSPDPQNQQWLGQATAMTSDGNELLLSGAYDGDPRALFPNVIFFGY